MTATDRYLVHAEHGVELHERIAELEELVRDMWHELDAATQYDAGGGRGAVYEFADRMRDLGVEV